MKYCGIVTDKSWYDQTSLFPGNKIIGIRGQYYDFLDDQDHQTRRIYSDEVPMADVHNFKYRNYGTMFPIDPQEINDILDDNEWKVENG